MKTEQELIIMMEELKTDERLYYKTATVFSNAPLALHQIAQECKLHLLENILGLPLSKFPLKKNKNENSKSL